MNTVDRLPNWAQDTILALALTAFTQWEISQAVFIEGPIWVQRATFAVMTLSTAGRRVAPLPATIVFSAGLVAQTVWGGEAAVVGGFLAGMLITHSVALYCSRWPAVAGLLVVLAAAHTYTFRHLDEFRLADEIGNTAIFVTIWALGRAVRLRQGQRDSAEDRAATAEAEREARERAAVANERARIARELHDIVAHGVSVMVLQAGAARSLLEDDPERARDALLVVESSGREALEEMQRLLGVLRRNDDGLAVTPLATLSHLDALLGHIREAGLPVTLRFEGDERPLPPSVELSAYRIVQEALTNALKHAGEATARVHIRYRPGTVEVEVTDTGTGQGASPRDDGQQKPSGGHGLIGMGERVALFGGQLHTGPSRSGGWTVKAVLPAEAHAA